MTEQDQQFVQTVQTKCTLDWEFFGPFVLLTAKVRSNSRKSSQEFIISAKWFKQQQQNKKKMARIANAAINDQLMSALDVVFHVVTQEYMDEYTSGTWHKTTNRYDDDLRGNLEAGNFDRIVKDMAYHNGYFYDVDDKAVFRPFYDGLGLHFSNHHADQDLLNATVARLKKNSKVREIRVEPAPHYDEEGDRLYFVYTPTQREFTLMANKNQGGMDTWTDICKKVNARRYNNSY